VPKASLREKFIKLKVNYELQMKKKKNSCKFLLFFRVKTSLRERNFFWGGGKIIKKFVDLKLFITFAT